MISVAISLQTQAMFSKTDTNHFKVSTPNLAIPAWKSYFTDQIKKLWNKLVKNLDFSYFFKTHRLNILLPTFDFKVLKEGYSHPELVFFSIYIPKNPSLNDEKLKSFPCTEAGNK